MKRWMKLNGKHRMKMLLFVIVVSLFVSGCASPGGIIRNSQGTTDYNPHQGSQGLELRFVKDNPPLTVYDTNDAHDKFPLMIEVWNRGAADIDGSTLDGYIYLSGYDPSILPGLAPYKRIAPLKGKSPYNSMGGYKIIDMSCNSGDSCATPSAELNLPDGVSEYRPRIQATACYEYITEASATVCIDGNPYTGIEDKPCRVGQVDGTGSQGAPVAVSSIEEIAMPGSVQFRIYVSNVGGGKVVDRNTITWPPATQGAHSCPQNLGFEDLGTLTYSVTLSGSPPSTACEPSADEFKLVDGRGVIFCTFDVPTTETYVAPLNIRLEYGYMQSISQDVTIRNIRTQ
ncbi:hypothetical protein D6764_02870 [Candidatus Woesearchaeota archaeon]|nr:MAG: hypothetical protein D6764_02870 [Candidatus Woesearchaeota archaeon]